jgi:hypothetical protein
MPFVQLVQAVVSIALSVVPEGLPALITVTLAIGVQRIPQRNVIIRHLPEGKQNLLKRNWHAYTYGDDGVSAITAESAYNVTGPGLHNRSLNPRKRKAARENPVLKLMVRAAILCNDSELGTSRRIMEGGGRPNRKERSIRFPSRAGSNKALSRPHFRA